VRATANISRAMAIRLRFAYDLHVISADRARLDNLNLRPAALPLAQVDRIMTGHLNVPDIEPDPKPQRTLAHNILQSTDAISSAIQGRIVTDAMDMGGITAAFRAGRSGGTAVAAGVDAAETGAGRRLRRFQGKR